MPDARVLVLFAHPAFHRSRVHRGLAKAVRDLAGVTFHDLYDAYPDFDVDAKREQALLAAHDAVVLQHPFYWYSTPALVKQWFDLVLEHGWAYGDGGTALAGKPLLSVISLGGHQSAYCEEGENRYSVEQLLAPVEQTLRLCGMRFLDPFLIYGTHAMTPSEIEDAGEAYVRRLTTLRDTGA